MHVLICDDDASARFVMKRLLTQHLGCVAEECGDGVAALARLDAGGIDLLVLDIQMPGLDGVEVLEAVRSSPALKELPVIMVSSERRETVIRRLVQLGVDGYILKPLRSEKVLSVLEPLRGRLAARQRQASGASLQECLLGPDSPALLVEGNLDYRHFFVSQAQRFGPIVEAPSGAAALARFREAPTRLVFLGSDIGIMRPELLVPKLRALAGGLPLHIVALLDDGDDGGPHAGDVGMQRTYLPEVFRAGLAPFIQTPSAVRAVTAVLGNPGQALESAARQVFGMMLDADISPVSMPEKLDGALGASATISLSQGPVVTLATIADPDSWTVIVSRMVGIDSSSVQVDDRLSAAGELVNLITGRLHALVGERGSQSECSLPRLEADASQWLIDDDREHRIRRPVLVNDTQARICFVLSMPTASAAE